MGVLDAFMSTWSKARETFGEGVPQTAGVVGNRRSHVYHKPSCRAAAVMSEKVSALRNHTLGAGGPSKLAATRGGRLASAESEPGTHRSSRSGAEGIMMIFKPAGLRRRSRSCGS